MTRISERRKALRWDGGRSGADCAGERKIEEPMGSDGNGRAGVSCKTTARTVVMIPEEKLLRRKKRG